MINTLKWLTGAALMVGLVAPSSAFAASDANIHGVQAAQVSLADAVTAAQSAAAGKAIYGKYDTRDNAGVYEIVVVSEGKTNTMDVDPATGKAIKAKREEAGKTDKKGAMTIEKAQVGLSAAISTAEMEGGKALEAMLDTKKNATAYEVEVANGDKTSTVWVDVNTGKIIKKS